MLFMTTNPSKCLQSAMLAHQDLFGRFLNPSRTMPDTSLWNNWVADNGAFSGFDQDAFMKKLKELLPYKTTGRMVTVPDVPFHWEPTLAKFHDWSPSLRRMGFPVGLAVQDGATVANIPWCEIDGVFIGGSTEWKRQQYRQVCDDLPLFSGIPARVERPTQVKDIVQEAKSRGLWVHIGRSANTPAQLWYAYLLGADSVDGTGEQYRPNLYFKWIAKTMWEIHQHKGKRNEPIQSRSPAGLFGEDRARSSAVEQGVRSLVCAGR